MTGKVVIDGEAVGLLARLLTESDLTEIEYKEGETHIRVAKQAAPLASYMPHAVPAPSVSAHVGTPDIQLTATASATVSSDTPVKSPLVGTLYRASDPAAPAFVEKGSTVKEGDILFIVEAMKVMNPIRAPRAGTVKEICVDNGAPVEFDQVLLYLSA